MSSALHGDLGLGPSSAWLGPGFVSWASVVGYIEVKASSVEALPFGRECLNMCFRKVRVTVYPGDFQQNVSN